MRFFGSFIIQCLSDLNFFGGDEVGFEEICFVVCSTAIVF